jgi:hypothetical protein
MNTDHEIDMMISTSETALHSCSSSKLGEVSNIVVEIIGTSTTKFVTKRETSLIVMKHITCDNDEHFTTVIGPVNCSYMIKKK